MEDLSVNKTKADDERATRGGELIVYMAGKTENLTRLRADVVEKKIAEKYSAVVKIEQAGRSLRIFCSTQQQKEQMLRGGSMAGVEIECTEPRAVRARVQARKRKIRKVSCGVPVD